jgi:hypothetical protein
MLESDFIISEEREINFGARQTNKKLLALLKLSWTVLDHVMLTYIKQRTNRGNKFGIKRSEYNREIHSSHFGCAPLVGE